MSHEVKPWTLPPCYVGELWPGFHTAGFGQSRDSDALEESNFRVAWKALKAIVEDNGTHEDIQIVREHHWAVGWVEWIAIPDDAEKALTLARELCERANEYPILDENDFSELESEQADQVWKDCYSTKERVAYIRDHSDQFDFHNLADMIGCVRGNYFAGYASEIL